MNNLKHNLAFIILLFLLIWYWYLFDELVFFSFISIFWNNVLEPSIDHRIIKRQDYILKAFFLPYVQEVVTYFI